MGWTVGSAAITKIVELGNDESGRSVSIWDNFATPSEHDRRRVFLTALTATLSV